MGMARGLEVGREAREGAPLALRGVRGRPAALKMEERQGLLKWTPSAVEREDARAPFGSTFSFDDE